MWVKNYQKMLRRKTNGREDGDSVKPDKKKVMKHSEPFNSWADVFLL